MKRIAIFASGSGTNAQNIMHYFDTNRKVDVSLVLSNKADAKVIERAAKYNVPTVTFNRDEFYNSSKILDLLKDKDIDLIVLAGFLWLVPENILKAYPNKIINIHPALLPKYGGKGMYGMKVHEAVLANSDNETGITIHYVNENYDEGDIIYQAKCYAKRVKSADEIADRVHQLEYEYYPIIIEEIIL